MGDGSSVFIVCIYYCIVDGMVLIVVMLFIIDGG